MYLHMLHFQFFLDAVRTYIDRRFIEINQWSASSYQVQNVSCRLSPDVWIQLMLSYHSVSLGPTALVSDSMPLVEVGEAMGTQLDPMRLPQ